MEAVKAAIAAPTTAAVIIEPVQGEGGARALPEVCLTGLREHCDAHGVLLIYDEIQCGLGRTGRLFAHEWAENAAPDIMCVAKALGDGFPVGACLATMKAAAGMGVGAHGSTYGGNPLAMAVGLAAFEELSRPETLEHVRDVANFFGQQLAGLRDRHPGVILEVRGKGLLIGLKLGPNNREFMQAARDEKLLIAGGGDNCVRLLPSLLITFDEASEAIAKLERVCEHFEAGGPGVTAPRHFLDLWDIDAASLRAILADAHARKAARSGWSRGRVDADAPAAGRTLAMIFERNSTRTRFSFDAAIRQLGGSGIISIGVRHAAGPGRDHRGYRAGAVAHGRCGDAALRQPREDREAGGGGDDPRHQRPDGRQSPVSDHGRPDDP